MNPKESILYLIIVILLINCMMKCSNGNLQLHLQSFFAQSFYLCYLFLPSKEKQYREILFMEGEKGRGGVAQVCEEANLSLYDGHIGAGFLFLRGGGKLKCASEEEEEEEEQEDNVVFGGKIDVGISICDFVESVDSYVVDWLAEEVWNSYFGRFSKWNHFESVLEEEGDGWEE
ncbi:uncharacterized protein LOC110031031 isoform X2 [Phalaenopsis equestris]|uniref:uncharacterized protein LOC110031031 isoform X2 n=1 Tax=Phalaenopsis equestris TaxID=78828 RepID=UPI0009E2B173|nr:uncharacterized protein LOC110031031 isoform X2 [Phalaenopsis equestris]